MKKLLLWAYFAGDAATMAKLIFFDCAHYTWWNWIVLVPIDIFLGTIWPIYWVVLRPLLGATGC